ncbi:MAG: hypothetical protein AAF268_02510 [Cyanobacteria bacterium P01_A01_bin.3]
MTWRHHVLKFGIWLVAEVLLNVYGLDNLADYSEYLFERHHGITSAQVHQVLMLEASA